eukprot:1385511-Rhodomonas_salina.1
MGTLANESRRSGSETTGIHNCSSSSCRRSVLTPAPHIRCETHLLLAGSLLPQVTGDLTRALYDESCTFTDEIDTYTLDKWYWPIHILNASTRCQVFLAISLRNACGCSSSLRAGCALLSALVSRLWTRIAAAGLKCGTARESSGLQCSEPTRPFLSLWSRVEGHVWRGAQDGRDFEAFPQRLQPHGARRACLRHRRRSASRYRCAAAVYGRVAARYAGRSAVWGWKCRFGMWKCRLWAQKRCLWAQMCSLRRQKRC